jgi:pimeloyl-ACP methyl ester carboxylesterase
MRGRARYLELSDARIRFRSAGRGPVVVLVHGWALDLDMWEPQLATLAEKFRVVAFDRRGFGSSSGMPSIEQDARDLRDLLDALDAPRAAIVGMSQGVRVAALCAASSPARVSALVLDGPPHEDARESGMPSGDVPIARYRELARRGDLDAVRHEWLGHPLMQPRIRDTRVQALLHEIVARYPGHDLRAPESRVAPLARVLRSVHAPTLVINGEEDSASRLAAGAQLARSMHAARHVLVPAAGHLPNLDNPIAYCEELSSFLRQAALAAPVANAAALDPLEKSK